MMKTIPTADLSTAVGGRSSFKRPLETHGFFKGQPKRTAAEIARSTAEAKAEDAAAFAKAQTRRAAERAAHPNPFAPMMRLLGVMPY